MYNRFYEYYEVYDIMKTHLLIIDAQNDFCDKNGALYVNGAEDDMQRLASFIIKHKNEINGITLTFDLHKRFHIASPVFWVDEKGKNPAPFTIISKDDVLNAHNFMKNLDEHWAQYLPVKD